MSDNNAETTLQFGMTVDPWVGLVPIVERLTLPLMQRVRDAFAEHGDNICLHREMTRDTFCLRRVEHTGQHEFLHDSEDLKLRRRVRALREGMIVTE